MSEVEDLLLEASARLFEQHYGERELRRSRRGEWLGEAWGAVEEMGLPFALTAAGSGGFGIALETGFAVARLAAWNGISAPIMETMLANRGLAGAGLPSSPGPAAIVPAEQGLGIAREKKGWRLRGLARRVPEGRHVAALVVEARDEQGRLRLALVPAACASLDSAGSNLAGMARDSLRLDCLLGDESVAPLERERLFMEGAALRTVQIAGALERLLDLTVDYVAQRVQFGRSLSSFQAVQQELARCAGHVASAAAAADMAVEAVAASREPDLLVAAARLRAGEAAGVVASIAHQLHGAIGFTQEHRLHLFTNAALAWRDEFGAHSEWSSLVARKVRAAGADGYWPLVAGAVR